MRSPSTTTRHGDSPVPPQIVEPANGVAVTVNQSGDEGRILDAFGGQHRRPARIVEDPAGESRAGSSAGAISSIEISAQRRRALRLLARLGMATRRVEIGEKTAAIEIGVGAGDGVGRGSCQLLAALDCLWQITGNTATWPVFFWETTAARKPSAR